MSPSIRLGAALSAVVVSVSLIGCGASSPPAAVERLPGKWHGEMIVYEDAVQGKLPPEKIAETKVVRTYLGGKVVFERK